MGSIIHELLKMFPDNAEIRPIIEISQRNHEPVVPIMRLIFPKDK